MRAAATRPRLGRPRGYNEQNLQRRQPGACSHCTSAAGDTDAITRNAFDALGDQGLDQPAQPNVRQRRERPDHDGRVQTLDQGQVQETKDPLGNISTWAFDSFGDNESLSAQAYGASGTRSGPITTYTVDADRDTLSQTDPDGNRTSWSLKLDGQATGETITVPGGTPDSTTVGDTTTATDRGTFTTPTGMSRQLLDFDDRLTTYAYTSLNQEAPEQWWSARNRWYGYEHD